MIDLNDHIGDAEKKQSRKDGYIFPGDLVTAYAAISAHSDVYGSTWLTYDPMPIAPPYLFFPELCGTLM